ncbi:MULTISPECIES: hypothetical protein [Providencia]|uniref:Uncharacterized protein n=3 Tax=Providencia TaxID=586 RepID=A0AA42JW12_9GAMM|nr:MULTISPECIES: hypothetical protein [Providencia]APC11585.1 hypothetical protein RB151_019090 [Providencia rettgeri]AVL74936.1 hypothetical protein CEQ08_14975 [Providencia rettgeri]EIL1984051.1 hypothetical protein [Providencia rettgeri]EIU9514857.1 hypothetical protein [Providencia rettgeri]EJD6041671.1 hypothetical protein [Providencia rettgeri]
MKKLIATFAGASMLLVLATAMILIVFPQQWKQNIYPTISQLLPTSLSTILPKSLVSNNVCDSLEDNLQNFASYLKVNQDIVDIKGMNSLDEQLTNIQARIDAMPSDVRDLVCQQEYSKLEGLKSVFSLGPNN